MSAAHEQLERVKRYLGLYKEINDGLVMTRSSDYYIDNVYAFFQNCQNLKDWIKNDNELSAAKRDTAEAHMAASNDLKLCADIANGTKHLVLSKKIHSAADPQFEELHERHFVYELGTGEVSVRFRLIFEGNLIDCYELARCYVDSWSDFLA